MVVTAGDNSTRFLSSNSTTCSNDIPSMDDDSVNLRDAKDVSVSNLAWGDGSTPAGKDGPNVAVVCGCVLVMMFTRTEVT